MEGASEVTVSPTLAEAAEEVSAGEAIAEVVSSAFFNFFAFLGNFLENPAGTKRSINSRSPSVRISSRIMNLDLQEWLDQNGTHRILNAGSSNMISSAPARLQKMSGS
jgi:hypothetical protein